MRISHRESAADVAPLFAKFSGGVRQLTLRVCLCVFMSALVLGRSEFIGRWVQRIAALKIIVMQFVCETSQ